MAALTLGSVEFQDFEIPESIPFGVEQRLAVKKLVGGGRVIDAMGADPVDIAWSGTFLGREAYPRALAIKQMAVAGLAQTLTLDAIRYQVVIASFHPDYRRNGLEIPYSISCTVLADTSTKWWPLVPSLNTSILNDMTTASSIAASAGNASVVSSMGALSSAIGNVPDFTQASRAVLQSVLTPLANVQAAVNLQVAGNEALLSGVTTVGGLLPNNAAVTLSAQLGGYAAANLQQPQLVQLQGVLGRMGVNIGSVNSSIRAITVSGGNLMDIASKQYGNPMGYTAILAANLFLKNDPQLTGITTLVIPQYTNQTDGIPG